MNVNSLFLTKTKRATKARAKPTATLTATVKFQEERQTCEANFALPFTNFDICLRLSYRA